MMTASSLIRETKLIAGELLVRFAPEAEAAIEQARQDAQLPSLRIDSLESLLVRYKVMAMNRVVPSSTRPGVVLAPLAEAVLETAMEHGTHDDLSRFYRLRLAPGTDPTAAVEAFNGDPYVELAQPNYLIMIHVK